MRVGRLAVHRKSFPSDDVNEVVGHELTGGTVSDCDALFAMLDGQVIRTGGGTWRAEVVGIHDDGQETWVQICPACQPGSGVIVRLPSGGHGDLALRALRAWSAIPEEARPRIIEAWAAA